MGHCLWRSPCDVRRVVSLFLVLVARILSLLDRVDEKVSTNINGTEKLTAASIPASFMIHCEWWALQLPPTRMEASETRYWHHHQIGQKHWREAETRTTAKYSCILAAIHHHGNTVEYAARLPFSLLAKSATIFCRYMHKRGRQ